jgi:tetraacyldisaccharide 4'-kinase
MARASGVPVVIARSRVEGARRIERDNLGDVIVLDDGFQHRRLKRNLNILSMFAGTEQAIDAFEQGEILPLGRFREDRDIGLRRASLLVVSERSVLPQGIDVPALDERILRIVPAGVPIFRSYYEFIEIRTLTGEPVTTPRTVHGFAGIANPQGFFESLRRVGYRVERTHEFPDHHPFSEDELAALIRENPGALFVCTEKDAVKIREMSERIRCSFAEFRVRLKVIPSDEFIAAIERALPGSSSRR